MHNTLHLGGNSPAEITRTRPAPRPMVVAPPVHPRVRPTARPPERLGPLRVQRALIAPERALEPRAQRIGLLARAVPPPGALRRARPGDQLEAPLVAAAVAARAVRVVPRRAACPLVRRPVRLLAVLACAH
jgi:hypothetical protein